MKLTTNATWLIACRVGSDLLSLLLFVAISRSFGPAGTGEFSYGFAIATLLLVIVSLGIDSFGLREYSRIASTERSAWMSELLGTQITMTAMAVAGLLVYLFLTRPTASTLIVVVALAGYQVMVALARTLFIPAISQERMVGPAVVDLLCRGAAVGAALIAIQFFAASVAWSLSGFPIAGILLVIIAARSASRNGTRVAATISRGSLQNIALALWSYAVADVIGQAFARISFFVLTVQSGVATTGLYAAGLKLLELACMPLVFLGVAAYPRLIQQYETDRPAFRRLADRLLWVMVLTSGGVAWGMYFVAPTLVIPVLGTKFIGTESVVRAMAAVAVVQAVEVIMWPMLIAAGLQFARVRAISIATVLSLVLNVMLIPRFGVNGAVLASVLSLTVIITLFSVSLRGALRPRSLRRVFLTLAGGILIASAVTRLLEHRSLASQAVASLAAFLGSIAVSYWLCGRSAHLVEQR